MIGQPLTWCSKHAVSSPSMSGLTTWCWVSVRQDQACSRTRQPDSQARSIRGRADLHECERAGWRATPFLAMAGQFAEVRGGSRLQRSPADTRVVNSNDDLPRNVPLERASKE